MKNRIIVIIFHDKTNQKPIIPLFSPQLNDMKKTVFLLIITPFLLLSYTRAKAQSGVTALINAVETLQFLKDIKANNVRIEERAREIKEKFREGDSTYVVIRDKYEVVRLAVDNILNTLVIDLMDKDKRRLFTDRPSMINEYYGENVQLYNYQVAEFMSAYKRSLKGDAGLLDVLKTLANVFLGELVTATRRIAIEILVEKLKAPYVMKPWKSI